MNKVGLDDYFMAGKTLADLQEHINKNSYEVRPECGFPFPENGAEWVIQDIGKPDPITLNGFDAGDKAYILGASKSYKTFFLMSMLLHIAAGRRKFLAWDIPKARRVLLFQFEISEKHFQKRLRHIMKSLNISPADLGDRFMIVNARGVPVDIEAGTFKNIIGMAQRLKPSVVALDPLYKLMTEENAAEKIKPLLYQFDLLCKTTGAALLSTHHFAKGFGGDKQLIDRGVGSGVISRDCDYAINITQHRDDGLYVIEEVQRNYPQHPAFSASFDSERLIFELDGAPPIVRDSKNARKSSEQGSFSEEDIVNIFKQHKKPMPKTAFMEKLKDFDLTERASRSTFETLLDDGTITIWKEPKFHGCTFVGLPEQINQKIKEYQNPDLIK